jgi:hypothetical protein
MADVSRSGRTVYLYPTGFLQRSLVELSTTVNRNDQQRQWHSNAGDADGIFPMSNVLYRSASKIWRNTSGFAKPYTVSYNRPLIHTEPHTYRFLETEAFLESVIRLGLSAVLLNTYHRDAGLWALM